MQLAQSAAQLQALEAAAGHGDAPAALLAPHADAADAARRGEPANAGAPGASAPAGSGQGLHPQLSASQVARTTLGGGAGMTAEGAAPAGSGPGSDPASQAPASQAAGAAAAADSSGREVGACADVAEQAKVCSGSQRTGDTGSALGFTSPAADAAWPGEGSGGAAARCLRKRSAERAAEAAPAADVLSVDEQTHNPDLEALAAADAEGSAGRRPAKRRRVAGGTLGTLLAWAWRTVCPAARCQMQVPGAAAAAASASSAHVAAGAPAAELGSGAQPAASCAPAGAEQLAANVAAHALPGGSGTPSASEGGASAQKLRVASPDVVLDTAAHAGQGPRSPARTAGQGQPAQAWPAPAAFCSPLAGEEQCKSSGSPSPMPRGEERGSEEPECGDEELEPDWVIGGRRCIDSASPELQRAAGAHGQGLPAGEQRRAFSSSPNPDEVGRWLCAHAHRVRSRIPALQAAAGVRAPAGEARSALSGSLSPEQRSEDCTAGDMQRSGARSGSSELQAVAGVHGQGPPTGSPSPEPRVDASSDREVAGARDRGVRVRTRSVRSASPRPRGAGGMRIWGSVSVEGAHGGGSPSCRCAPAHLTRGLLTPTIFGVLLFIMLNLSVSSEAHHGAPVTIALQGMALVACCPWHLLVVHELFSAALLACTASHTCALRQMLSLCAR